MIQRLLMILILSTFLLCTGCTALQFDRPFAKDFSIGSANSTALVIMGVTALVAGGAELLKDKGPSIEDPEPFNVWDYADAWKEKPSG